MRRSIKYLLLFMVALTVAFGWNATSVYATEAGDGITTGENVRTGKAGTNGGFTWTFDQNTKTLTVTGEDSGLGSSDYATKYDPFLPIAREAETLILQNCKISGGMNGAFSNCVSLKAVEFRNTDTSKVTGMRCMFDNCIALPQLYMNGLDTSSVTDMSYMFYGCNSLKTLYMNELDTSNVTDMSYMFYGSGLNQLDLSGIDTSNVTDMRHMFHGCNSLKTLYMNELNISNVTDMSYMFYGSGLNQLDLSGIDTSNVTDMRYMFHGCNNLKTLKMNGLNASKVTNMDCMFAFCNNLTKLNLKGFKTKEIIDMRYMFLRCSSLTSLDLSGFNTSNVTEMFSMFYGCSGLTSLDLSNFETSNVTDMFEMFGECSSLTSLDLSNFDTSNVTDMTDMFYGCSGLKSLDLSNFETSNVTDMADMFYGCSSLKSLDLSSFDTSNVTDMMEMFYGCSSLKSLDLSSFDTSKATNMFDIYKMFGECSKLESIHTPKKMAKGQEIELPHAFMDMNGKKVTYIRPAFCNTVLYKEILKIVADTTELTVGETLQLALKLYGVKQNVSENGNYKWSVASEKVATVSDTGLVTAVGAGTTTITVTGKIGNGDSVVSRDVDIMVTPKLAIISQPTGQTVEVGESATFAVEAQGSELSYQWQYKRVGANEWIKSGMTGAKTNSITVQGTDGRNGYKYRCVITDGKGNKVTSKAVTLTVVPKLAIISQPTSQTVEAGESATFVVEAQGSELSYQWQYKRVGATEWIKSGMTGAKTNSITVQGTDGRNGYKYRCVITAGNGNKVTSKTVTLTVTPKMAITSQPANQSVEEGANAEFKVAATGSKLSYQWQFKKAGENEWKDSGMTGAKTASLTVQGIATRNGQQYRCIIIDGSGNKVTSDGAILTVNEVALTITDHPTNQSVAESDNAVFKVTAIGSNLKYQWQFKTAGASTWTNSGMTGYNTAGITVQATAARNGYQYRCVITDGSGNKVISNEASLTVTEAVLTITGQPTSQSVNKGANAVFKVTATGSNLKYQWQFKAAGASTWKNSGMTGYNTAGITVQGTTARNGYQYRCIITDGSGNKVTSNAATLTVN